MLNRASLVRAIPIAALVGFTWALAWDTGGSIRAADWLPYAVAAACVLAAVLLAGAAIQPTRVALSSAALLVAFAIWTAVSAAWSPLPSLARDEALLALVYAVAFLVPLVTLRTLADRVAAMVVVVGGLTLLTLATAVRLRTGGEPELLYFGGRLDFPITYWNGEAAMALIAFWPAIALASERRLHPLLRGCALGGGAAMLALWVGTQSKGGGVSLAVSAIVFFAVSRSRLRALVPSALAAGIAAVAATPLTEPFRTEDAAFENAVRHAGTATLVVAAFAAVAGCLYAFADRRLQVSGRIRRIAGIAVASLLAVALLSGLGAFLSSVDHPVGWTQARWNEFKRLDTGASASSHFGQLGSNRYDFWRVALDEFERHPVAGIGGHGWPTAYRRHGESEERPQRAHSLEFDALSETGIVGFLLVVTAGALALFAVGRLARDSLLAAGALGTGAYFAVHTGGDWVWTIAAVGVPAFLIVGIGASVDRERPLPTRVAMPAGIAAIAIAALAFAPPWLSNRLVDRAYRASSTADALHDLRWARRLDPLAVEPLIAESARLGGRAGLLPLERALAKQPRDSELYFLLGRAYLDAGRKADARRVLRTALLLSPRNDAVRVVLREAR